MPIDFITAPKASLESIVASGGKSDVKPKVEEEEPVTTGAKKTGGKSKENQTGNSKNSKEMEEKLEVSEI